MVLQVSRLAIPILARYRCSTGSDSNARRVGDERDDRAEHHINDRHLIGCRIKAADMEHHHGIKDGRASTKYEVW